MSSDKDLNEFQCPICLNLLLEPVTTPCAHSACKECFAASIHESSLNCPICRKRLGIWYRQASKKKKLLDEKLWDYIIAHFPESVEERKAGKVVIEASGPSVAYDQGAVREWYESEMQREKEEETDMVRKSEELARRLQEGEMANVDTSSSTQRMDAVEHSEVDDEAVLVQQKILQEIEERKKRELADQELAKELDGLWNKRQQATRQRGDPDFYALRRCDVNTRGRSSRSLSPTCQQVKDKLPELRINKKAVKRRKGKGLSEAVEAESGSGTQDRSDELSVALFTRRRTTDGNVKSVKEKAEKKNPKSGTGKSENKNSGEMLKPFKEKSENKEPRKQLEGEQVVETGRMRSKRGSGSKTQVDFQPPKVEKQRNVRSEAKDSELQKDKMKEVEKDHKESESDARRNERVTINKGERVKRKASKGETSAMNVELDKVEDEEKNHMDRKVDTEFGVKMNAKGRKSAKKNLELETKVDGLTKKVEKQNKRIEEVGNEQNVEIEKEKFENGRTSRSGSESPALIVRRVSRRGQDNLVKRDEYTRKSVDSSVEKENASDLESEGSGPVLRRAKRSRTNVDSLQTVTCVDLRERRNFEKMDSWEHLQQPGTHSKSAEYDFIASQSPIKAKPNRVYANRRPKKGKSNFDEQIEKVGKAITKRWNDGACGSDSEAGSPQAKKDSKKVGRSGKENELGLEKGTGSNLEIELDFSQSRSISPEF